MLFRVGWVVVGLLATGALAGAADWPQWGGPDRNAVSKETGLLKAWPSGGPKLLWTYDKAGIGYSSPSIVGDTLYCLGGEGGKEFAFALDTKSGKQKWKVPLGSEYKNGYGGGPRSTPTIDDGSMYFLCADGGLYCLETTSGKQRWQVSLSRDLGGKMMSGWGYSESPLIDGDKLICTPGAGNGSMAALDKKSGKVLWRSNGLTANAAYSSAIVAEVGGIRHYVQMTREGLVGVSTDGKVLWQQNVCVNGVAICPSPIFSDNCVYITSDYGAGCALVKLTASGGGIQSELVYNNKNMQNHHGGVVLIDGYLYGCSGNVNNKKPRFDWECQEFKTGKVVWKDDQKFEAGSVVYADGYIYCYGQVKGNVVRIEASPKGWQENGRFTIPKETSIPRGTGQIWTHPVIANGKLYLRDQDLLFCYDISAK
ncbi:MAG TPA: PQQ-binding-like beta-propeller repeat protein [Gemmataceae bacterium]|nr:PQQ-binding-like beta-propeller repeat protein [Gemmataceae bacterium]